MQRIHPFCFAYNHTIPRNDCFRIDEMFPLLSALYLIQFVWKFAH